MLVVGRVDRGCRKHSIMLSIIPFCYYPYALLFIQSEGHHLVKEGRDCLSRNNKDPVTFVMCKKKYLVIGVFWWGAKGGPSSSALNCLNEVIN